jgi:hypothetical protein
MSIEHWWNYIDMEKPLRLTLQNPVVTICTTMFNIHKFYVLATVYLCVLCGSQNKQRLFHCTTLTDWFV